ncbi:hypothetical protein DFH08DRAFT_1039343 [Mycena albidolilacea]|uniref:Uncharacterized protein n=1 Tax=Mycena albidolilacea TaxID=1033008 RepID=A0AAD6ZD50_9AGAR|nr:hypothetical protein DFH08DRAFT_1039343 [Mycena albidolilacea]
MVSTRKGTYETPPPTPRRRKSLHQEVVNADAIPRGDLDSDSYWSGSESSDNSAKEHTAVASSKDSASVLSGDSTKGWSIGSPEALNIISAGGRIEPELSHSVVLSDLRHNAIPRTSLPSMAIGSSSQDETGASSGLRDALDFVTVSSVKSEPDIISLPSMAIGPTSSQEETGLLVSCVQALSASVPVAASFVIPAPDNSSVVTAGNDRHAIVAGTSSVSLPSIESSSDTIQHVPGIGASQFVLPKIFARHIPDSVNNFLDTSPRFFPLWFRQSIETGKDATDTPQDISVADSDSDTSSGAMVLYAPIESSVARS